MDGQPCPVKLPLKPGRIVRPAMPVGFQQIRESHGVSIGVEMLKIRDTLPLICVVRAALDVFEAGRRSCGKKMLRSQT